MTEVRRFPVTGRGEGREDYSAPVLGPSAKEMRTERRSTTSNDNGVVGPNAPPTNYTALTHRGKFFTRGCRGMIEEIQIYCIRTAAGTLTLRYSPHPSLGPFGQVTITPGATWAWVGAAVENMWSYDSLFIWIVTCSADVSWAYDAVQPHDGHMTTDGGATWADLTIRMFIRVIYTGETPGDVPVSGIINNIPLPNTSSLSRSLSKPINAATWTDLINIYGTGYTNPIIFRVQASASSDITELAVYCDGILAFDLSFRNFNDFGFTADATSYALTAYAVNGECVMVLNKQWEFRRICLLRALNPLAAQTVDIWAYPTLLR